MSGSRCGAGRGESACIAVTSSTILRFDKSLKTVHIIQGDWMHVGAYWNTGCI